MKSALVVPHPLETLRGVPTPNPAFVPGHSLQAFLNLGPVSPQPLPPHLRRLVRSFFSQRELTIGLASFLWRRGWGRGEGGRGLQLQVAQCSLCSRGGDAPGGWALPISTAAAGGGSQGRGRGRQGLGGTGIFRLGRLRWSFFLHLSTLLSWSTYYVPGSMLCSSAEGVNGAQLDWANAVE